MNWKLIINVVVLLIWIVNVVSFDVKEGRRLSALTGIFFIMFATYMIVR